MMKVKYTLKLTLEELDLIALALGHYVGSLPHKSSETCGSGASILEAIQRAVRPEGRDVRNES